MLICFLVGAFGTIWLTLHFMKNKVNGGKKK
jgi:hypothetical protein